MVVKPNYCLHFSFVTTILGIIISLCILPSTQVLYEKYRNDFYNTVDDLYCLTPQGASGKCLAIHECPESKKLIISNVKPKICAWIVRIPIICCPLHIKFEPQSTQAPVLKTWTTGAPNTTASTSGTSTRVKFNSTFNYTAKPTTSRYSITASTSTSTLALISISMSTTTTTTTTPFPATIAPISVELPNRLPFSPSYSEKPEATTTHLTLNVNNDDFEAEDRDEDHDADESENNEEYQIPLCGTRVIKKNRYRIVGGTEAYPGEFPWSAALFSKSLDGRLVHECGGTIISDRHILTAAHCFTTFNVNNYVIGVGSGLLWRTLKYEIKTIITHPGYNAAYYYSDIALIETKTEIKFNIFVRPVCLPYKNLVHSGDEVSIAGWGYLNYNGQKSDVLNKAHLNIISRKTCNDTYSKHRSNKIPIGISEHFICAGAPDYSRDACEADSGGALLKREISSPRMPMPLKEYEGRFVQIGIVSFGYKCAHDGYPGVYTDVAHFIHWIKENVDLRNSKSPPLL